MTFDPSQYSGFEWDAGNETKRATKHHVSPAEAEEVFRNQPLVVLGDPQHSEAEQRFCTWGKSNAERLLQVAFTMRGDRIRVISARPMSRKERSIYAQK
ncbi:MAG: BrnT family toxin [Verrucomicrobia bacterium]|nr:BrnT family toxin [Verrucomicrobiota bacterium]